MRLLLLSSTIGLGALAQSVVTNQTTSATSTTLVSQTTTSSVSLAAASSAAPPSPIESCLAAAGVPYDVRNSTDWKNDVRPFNNRLKWTPVAIAVPSTAADVQGAVNCSAQLGLKVNPKSGGHSYASFGLGGEDGHLVVELDRMYNVTLDNSTGIAQVQGGARLGHIATQLYELGGRAFSHGTCPGVGVGGHSLHGGYGFSSHTHGMALDWIAGASVVLANGSLVECSATENQDLYWALRGAGSSFGIVTEFRFNTFVVPQYVVPFSLRPNIRTSADLASVLSAFQNYTLDGMPAEMNMRFQLAAYSTEFEGLYHGTNDSMVAALQPLLTMLNITDFDGARAVDWMTGFDDYAYSGQIDITSSTYSAQETFFSKSLTTAEMSADVIQAYADYWYDTARNLRRDWWVLIDGAGGNTSAFAAVPNDATAFASRDKVFIWQLYDKSDNGTYPGDWAFGFLDGWVETITDSMDTSQWGMYENYADPSMNRTYATENYFRGNLPRLQRIKYALDPDEVFYFPQAIQPVQDAGL